MKNESNNETKQRKLAKEAIRMRKRKELIEKYRNKANNQCTKGKQP
jgi:hypothetical protein